MISHTESSVRSDDTLRHQLFASLDRAQEGNDPFRHWLLTDVLPVSTMRAIAELPVPPAEIGDTGGKRETHNSLRVFFAPPLADRHGVCGAVARMFQDDETVGRLAAHCGAALDGTFVRIEYCQDLDGFWLEPHTDIGAKRFTFLISLSEGPEAEGWGTDVYSSDLSRRTTLPWKADQGLIFVPGPDTWHGFHRRPIRGVRRTLIVNYVGPEWRARHELAFADRPVSGPRPPARRDPVAQSEG